MQIYLVGGAVRDALLGMPVQDRDWVVVGGTPEAMVSLGFAPVGKDFPVFLHPQTHEEYALARTERKSGHGYKGFVVQASPGVSLEDDLARRDLTINAIAQALHPDPVTGRIDPAHPGPGTLIDPWGGQQDLHQRVLRHVTPAFREDPVRILRVARFAARFPDFTLAPETLALMQEMVEDGEVDHLVPERADYHPEVDTGVHAMMVLDMSARLQAPLAVRYACLGHDLGKGTTPADVLLRHIGHEERSARLLKDVAQRLRVPVDCRELADVVAREHGNLHRSSDFGAAALVRLLERCDALRKPERFEEILLACECDARGRLGLEEKPYPQAAHLRQVLATARSVITADVAAEAATRGAQGKAVGDAVHAARVHAVAQSLGV